MFLHIMPTLSAWNKVKPTVNATNRENESWAVLREPSVLQVLSGNPHLFFVHPVNHSSYCNRFNLTITVAVTKCLCSVCSSSTDQLSWRLYKCRQNVSDFTSISLSLEQQSYCSQRQIRPTTGNQSNVPWPSTHIRVNRCPNQFSAALDRVSCAPRF